ncbi:ABC transporter ATP-binding protein [Pandoraea terrae]|uniref:ABC transporter ATP-binding protein n=1 Tax=Pandoraea terrae TaxID=1537710 RepID=A0A5E4ZF42_9BURK|nr:ABC transporter ATP-binding protein [Pandoraea terrae]VVE59646.1 ABC transporter ATP-binding protein [Pandoraea terrae]
MPDAFSQNVTPAAGAVAAAPFLSLDRIRVTYANAGRPHTVVQDLSLALARGEIGCLLGPSGCGKTTVLKAVCGFEPVSAGRIVLGGREVASAALSEPPEHRHVGVVFQDYALFPHLDVAQNIGFGLHATARRERQAKVSELAELVGLSEVLRKYPHELSGGQQQRVALARALAPSPALLLLDEPFSNLDLDLRERLAVEVRDIVKASGTTAILVTHDQHEAFAMADAIGVMHEGRLAQWADAYTLYHAPASRVVADFIGLGAVLPGAYRPADNGAGTVSLELGELPLPPGRAVSWHAPHDARHHGRVDVLLRADDIVVDGASPHAALLVRRAFRGADALYTLRLDSGREVLARVGSDEDHAGYAVGDRIGIRLVARHAVAFPSTE